MPYARRDPDRHVLSSVLLEDSHIAIAARGRIPNLCGTDSPVGLLRHRFHAILNRALTEEE
jgi:hypothetical protein